MSISRPSNIPPLSLNGGLYTGTPFLPNAPWGNVPVIPDVDYMTHVNLRSACPPTEALSQYPGGPRPGNNNQNMPGVDMRPNPISCITQQPNCERNPNNANMCNNDGRFIKYMYL